MKFVGAMLAVLLICLVLGVGMWMGSHGQGWWFLGLGSLGFLGLFIRYGCRSHG